ncbi:MAG: hypothetical protein WC968_02940 [Bacilli bacterium]
MKIKNRLDIIKFDNIEVLLNEMLKSLAKLPVSDLVAYLTIDQKFANRDHATILKNVMRDEVWKFKLVSKVAEKGLSNDFFARLDYFEDSPVTVLENLFEKMVKIQPEMIDDYLEDMWLFALQVISGKDGVLHELYYKSLKAKTSKIVLKELFPLINSVFDDEVGDLDGVHVKTFVEKAANSATIKELREIALKKNVNLPTSLTRQDMIDNIVALLPSVTKAKDLPHIVEDVKEMTIAELKAFIEKYKLDVPTELHKRDLSELLVKNYTPNNIAVVSEPIFVLPERVDTRDDFSDENPKIKRLTEKVKSLEEALKERPDRKTVVDQERYQEAESKRLALDQEVTTLKAELAVKPKEVMVEVPGPTIVRTVVSKQALLKQKEKYEAIIADQEKERALLISRIDEHDQLMSEYAKIKTLLAEKEAEEDVKEETPAVTPVVTAPSTFTNEPLEMGATYGALYAKIDRLVDKVHELQLEMVRKEQQVAPAIKTEEPERDTEVNIYFDSNLARKLAAQNEHNKADAKKKKRRGKRRKLPLFIRIILWLILIAIVIFFGGWLLQYYAVFPLGGTNFFISALNAAVAFLYNITEGLFIFVRSIWASIFGN